jgi:hypothetical protein
MLEEVTQSIRSLAERILTTDFELSYIDNHQKQEALRLSIEHGKVNYVYMSGGEARHAFCLQL